MISAPTPGFRWMPARRFDSPAPYHYLEFRLDGHTLQPDELTDIRLPAGLVAEQAAGLMLSGKGPGWLYCHLVHLAAGCAWAAVYDRRLGGVVIQRRAADAPSIGAVIPHDVKAGPPATAPLDPQLSWSVEESAGW